MKKYVFMFLGLFLCFSAYSQSADVITKILNEPEVTFGQVCYLSAVQQNFIDEDASFEDAVDAIYKNGQILSKVDPSEIISLFDAVYIFSSMWEIKGGLMFTLTKGSPRYVFKQFQTDKVIAGDADPKSNLSGTSLLRMYTACEKKYGKTLSQEAE